MQYEVFVQLCVRVVSKSSSVCPVVIPESQVQVLALDEFPLVISPSGIIDFLSVAAWVPGRGGPFQVPA